MRAFPSPLPRSTNSDVRLDNVERGRTTTTIRSLLAVPPRSPTLPLPSPPLPILNYTVSTHPTLPPSLQPGSLLPCRVRCHSPLEQDVKIDDGVSSPFRLRAARAQAAAAAGLADLRTEDRLSAKIQKLSSSLFVISSKPLCPRRHLSVAA